MTGPHRTDTRSTDTRSTDTRSTDTRSTGTPSGRATAAKAAAARTAAALNPRPSRVRPYQRRRRGPVAVVVAVLAVATIATWATVLSTASDGFGDSTCPPPTAGPPVPGETVERSAFYDVQPGPLASVRVLVTNAGGQRGQANLVAAELSELGFAEAGPPSNDTYYPDGDMECSGQLRFGPAGEQAAATLALALPCVELVRDTRTEDTVDLAVGTAFGDLSPSRAARDALEQLSASNGGSDGATNADPSAPDAAPPPAPTVDPALLQQIREGSC